MNRAGRVTRIAGRVVGAVVSAALLAVSAYAWVAFRHIDSGITRLAITPDGTPAGSSAPAPYHGAAQNILLVGNDDRSNMTRAEQLQLRTGRGDGSNATDTMIILHVPGDGSRATLISLPRDSYVHIPGFQDNKLNAAYVDGYYSRSSASTSLDQRRADGANLLIRTVRELTGLHLDHYIQVSLLGFYEISTAIGGVPVDLCHSVNDTVAYNAAHGVTGGSGLVLSKGRHLISGVQALEFVRQRHNFPGDREDLGRVRRQQYFLAAAFRKVASVGILLKLRSLGTALSRTVYLDPGLDLLGLARQLENLDPNNIVGKTIPTRSEILSDGTDVLAVSPSRVRRYVRAVIAGPDARAASGSTHRGTGSAAPRPRSTPKRAIDAACID